MFELIMDYVMKGMLIVAGLYFVIMMVAWCVAVHESEKVRKSIDSTNREYVKNSG